jgi:hypothetical protein
MVRVRIRGRVTVRIRVIRVRMRVVLFMPLVLFNLPLRKPICLSATNCFYLVPFVNLSVCRPQTLCASKNKKNK